MVAKENICLDHTLNDLLETNSSQKKRNLPKLTVVSPRTFAGDKVSFLVWVFVRYLMYAGVCVYLPVCLHAYVAHAHWIGL